MSGAAKRKQRRENALRATLMKRVITQVATLEAEPSRATMRETVAIMLEVENAVRCLNELRKRGELGMHARAAKLAQEIEGRLNPNPDQLVAFAAKRGVRDVSDIATFFTAIIVDPRMHVKTVNGK